MNTHEHVCVPGESEDRGRRKVMPYAGAPLWKCPSGDLAVLFCFALLCFALLCFVFAFQFVVRLEVTDRSVVCSVFSGTGISRVRHIHQHSPD